MVEVFKTNVTKHRQAKMLVDQIQENFIDHKANFDLQDCDKILRVKSTNGTIQSSQLIERLQQFGFEAEVLPDEMPVGL